MWADLPCYHGPSVNTVWDQRLALLKSQPKPPRRWLVAMVSEQPLEVGGWYTILRCKDLEGGNATFQQRPRFPNTCSVVPPNADRNIKLLKVPRRYEHHLWRCETAVCEAMNQLWLWRCGILRRNSCREEKRKDRNGSLWNKLGFSPLDLYCFFKWYSHYILPHNNNKKVMILSLTERTDFK